jgi:hypothetical protein
MDFETYYKSLFESDLRALLAAIPPRWQHSFWDDPEAYSIQVERLQEGDAIEVIPVERRPLFAVCLCWTVLIDQATYTYARQYYPRFRALAAYPKLTGNGTWSHRCTTPFYAIEWMWYGDPNGKAKAMALMNPAKEFFRIDLPESFGRLFSIPTDVSNDVFRECLRELEGTAK